MPARVQVAVPKISSHTPTRSSQSLSGQSSAPPSRKSVHTASCVATPTRSPPVPKHRATQPTHPDNIKLPTIPVNEFYVVIVGQETGIFYSWRDAAARVLGVSKNIHFKCATFQEALRCYKNAYDCNEVQCMPNPGTQFYSQGMLNTAHSGARSTPFEESASDVEYWRNVDDLSDEISRFHVAE
ncbi:hypothetical protein EDD15DRAFT_2168485 [Pisolithus albus]|nr:hypothetical protein EDD15DRAFT_2168485 [Pisolithus albus]